MPHPTVLFSILAAIGFAPVANAQPGSGGPGGPRREQTALVERFDTDGNKRLERDERDAARAWLKENGEQRRGRRGGRGPGRGPGDDEPRPPGARIAQGEVATFADRPLYDTDIVRTFFLQFEADDWEAELAAFYGSDVEVPADLTVDGEKFEQIGVHFRGNTSFMMVPAGQKRSLNLSIDFTEKGRKLYGCDTLNLLNCHSDPSFLREVLHASIGRQFAPMPRANFVHVVINGESWGVYANVQQVDKNYLDDAFGNRDGARWRVPPDFSGRAGLTWLGDDVADYKAAYTAKGAVDAQAWQRLIELCRVLADPSIDERRTRLPAMLDIDGALWFLATDNVLLDGDGYLTRASDYMLHMDPEGVFHLITHDNNEILGGGMRRGGPGGVAPPTDRREPPPGGDPRGGRGGGPSGPGGVRLEPGQSPLTGADNDKRPLLHALLDVPEWRARYLAHVHRMAQALDWQRLGPEIERLHALITDLVHADTRKLYSNEAFDTSIENLRQMIDKRRTALLAHESLAGDWPSIESVATEVIGEGEQRQLRFEVRTSADVGEVWLHWQPKRSTPFASTQLTRDADGRFTGAMTAPKKLRYYVEARANGESGRVCFEPAGAASKPARYEEANAPEPLARSLLGEPLFAAELDAATRTERTAQLAEAQARLHDDPGSVDALIQVGRRLAYLGRYREAIETYSRGLAAHPDEPRLYRHRGHRLLTLRQLDAAMRDFERAADLIEGQPDEVEPDGQPNARNLPTSTLHFNVHYHGGLVHYLAGRFEEALVWYGRCLAVSRNPDALCATSHWAYMTLRRLGRDAEAAALLAPISADLDVIENHGYHQLLLMYRDERTLAQLIDGEGDAVASSTVAYGVANWHLYNGEPERAREMFERIVRGPAWAAFGHLAAEAELARDR